MAKGTDADRRVTHSHFHVGNGHHRHGHWHAHNAREQDDHEHGHSRLDVWPHDGCTVEQLPKVVEKAEKPKPRTRRPKTPVA